MERLKALQAAIDAHGPELVVVGPTANMRYLTGYRAMAVERITVLLVGRDAVGVVIPDFDAGEFRDTTGLEAVFEWSDKDGPSEAIDRGFQSLGLSGRKVSAAVDDELRFDFFTRLRGFLAEQPRRASELLGPLRLSKTAAEQECIRRAGELVSYGIDIALERARPGMTELELKRTIEDALWDEGAESVDFVLVQAGANSAVGHHNANKTALRPEEPVLIDIAARVDGYFADITQQVFLGTPPPEYVHIYEIVAEAQEQGVRAAAVGGRWRRDRTRTGDRDHGGAGRLPLGQIRHPHRRHGDRHGRRRAASHAGCPPTLREVGMFGSVAGGRATMTRGSLFGR